jgi:TolA-binding protein
VKRSASGRRGAGFPAHQRQDGHRGWRRACQLVAVATSGLVLTACVKDDAGPEREMPSIASIGRKADPAANPLLKIEPSAPVQSQPYQALENYRRLLELQTSGEVRSEAMRRVADLQIQVQDQRGASADESAQTVAESIKLYQRLLKERPEDPRNDQVLYQLARSYQNSGQTDVAIDTLLRLEQEYPLSNIALDAHDRAAELLYLRHRYEEAEREYRAVLSFGTASVFADSAQYKLGWTQYAEGKYADDIETFSAILDRVLPKDIASDAMDEPATVLAKVKPEKADLASDSLRAIGLSFKEMGGGPGINKYYETHPEPRFIAVIYNALGETMIAKQRFTDAALTYLAFIERHPNSPLAPKFQSKVIAANDLAGFDDTVLAEKERYINTYAPTAPFWQGRTPSPDVVATLRRYLDETAQYHHALAQADRKGHAKEFLVAAAGYRKVLENFPNDPKAPEINLLLADSLLDGGQIRAAADEYSRTAYAYPRHAKSEDAAYAALQTYEKLAASAAPEQKNEALHLAADSAVKLADTFPSHPQRLTALTRAAENLHAIGDLPGTIAVAGRVIAANPPAPANLLTSAWAVTADSQFAQNHFADAEAGYRQLLQLLPQADPGYPVASERLSASIYKQAENARGTGDLHAAAQGFLRAAQSATASNVQATATYDAAAAYLQLGDWSGAEQVLESFRARFPSDPLIPDVEKKLAVAYEKDHKPRQSAVAYQRVAARTTETSEVRSASAYAAARLLQQAGALGEAAQAFESAVAQYPSPADRQLDACEQLATIYLAEHDTARYQIALRNLIAANAQAGSAATDRSKALAARASLEIGRDQAQAAKALRLTLPIKTSLAAKKQATELAITTLTQAADFGFADVATAATFELGTLYQNFARSLLDSERPAKLGEAELEQYNLLLEEQADPFEVKAIQAHEVNLQRLRAKVYDEWVARSVDALATLSPARYGKLEQKEASDEAFH